MNDKLVDFLQAAQVRHRVSPGCGAQNDEPNDVEDSEADSLVRDVCERKPCKNEATCVSKPKTEKGYACSCKDGFKGFNCDIKGEIRRR